MGDRKFTNIRFRNMDGSFKKTYDYILMILCVSFGVFIHKMFFGYWYINMNNLENTAVLERTIIYIPIIIFTLFRLYRHYRNGLIFAKPLNKDELEKRTNGLFYKKNNKYAFTGIVKANNTNKNFKYYSRYINGILINEEIHDKNNKIIDFISYNNDGTIIYCCTSKEKKISEVRKDIRQYNQNIFKFNTYILLMLGFMLSVLLMNYIDLFSGNILMILTIYSSIYKIYSFEIYLPGITNRSDCVIK